MLKQIGKYTISERIGRGTYSRVYRAVETQGRSVAIKVSTTQTEPRQLDEFQRDLVSAASVLHPNLVSVYDLGFEDDFPYLVMELVEGHDLDRLLKNNAAPSLAERVRVLQEAAAALQAAHERSVFHLDVRPSKIMLADSGAAKLLDLGLGRLSFDPARVTKQGYLVGAPFYMSPERLTAIDTANESCDIWSFGVTSYEWICGYHPFYDDDGDRMVGNIMDAIPADLPNVPVELSRTVLRALEKDPAGRYRSFNELLADLQPLARSLKREESDALMAEALKQTDSGRWHEARRIARQLRDDSRQAPPSPIFGISELESEGTGQLVGPASASSFAATVVETTEPAQMPVSPSFNETPPVARPAVATATTTIRHPRPERTAPKISTIGSRNGGTSPGGNGSSASTRIPPPAGATNGAPRMAAPTSNLAATQTSPVFREMTAPKTDQPRTEQKRRRRRRSSQPSQSLPARKSGIFDGEQASGFPWSRVLIFAFATLLLTVAGYVMFQLADRPKAGSEDAKEVSRTGRVIPNAPGETVDPLHTLDPKMAAAPPPTGPVTASVPASTGVTNTPASGDNTTVTVTADPLDAAAPRAFDPRTLAPVKPAAPPRRRGKAPLLGVAAPVLPALSEGTDLLALPVALNAPRPPAAAPLTTPPQSVEAAREAAIQVGGSFAKPVLVQTVQPVYPPAALQKKTQGAVRFQATIAKDGSVKNIQLLSGDPILSAAAREAVLQWRYQPALLNGDPIEVTQAIVINFGVNPH